METQLLAHLIKHAVDSRVREAMEREVDQHERQRIQEPTAQCDASENFVRDMKEYQSINGWKRETMIE